MNGLLISLKEKTLESTRVSKYNMTCLVSCNLQKNTGCSCRAKIAYKLILVDGFACFTVFEILLYFLTS